MSLLKYDAIFFCQTLYHLYVSLLVVEAEYRRSRCLIVFSSDHQCVSAGAFNLDAMCGVDLDIIDVNESKIVDDFRSGNLFRCSRFLSQNVHIGRLGVLSAGAYLRGVKPFCDIDFSHSKIYAFHDKTFFSKLYLNFGDLTLVEDGLANYVRHDVVGPRIKKVIRKFKGLDPDSHVIGECASVSRILLKNPTGAPVEIRRKCESLPEYVSTDARSLERVSSFFRVSAVRDYDIIFLTQGLDVAGLCSSDEKFHLYKSLILHILKRSSFSVALKPHPSESKSQYDDLFRGVSIDILDPKVPFEVVMPHCRAGAKIVSLFTSTAPMQGDGVVNLLDETSSWNSGRGFDLEGMIMDSKSKFDELFFDSRASC